MRQKQNMRDWARRMSEYFAHHLKREQASKWMTDGAPFHVGDTDKLPSAPNHIDTYV